MIQQIQEQLDELALAVSAHLWSKTRSWAGAGVVIRKKPPQTEGGGYPYSAVTKHAGELSWLFMRLRDIACEFEDFYLFKYSFFTQLAEAAVTVSSEESIDILLLTTLREAYQFFAESEVRGVANHWTPVFESDSVLQRNPTRLQKVSVIKFYRSRGIAI